jgi:hypothetical protein|tara:strand:- start:1430 stop:1894 length:465 start_codon:yes stop_codon:yes gene_type:complete
MNILVLDHLLVNPDKYVEKVLEGEFVDVEDGDYTFKGIQVRDNDELAIIVKSIYPEYRIVYNFIRQSPEFQKEPNFKHTDEMMGDKTVLLYLNKKHPKEAGTTLYEEGDPACTIYYKYNRMVVFDSEICHSRNLKDNFGSGNNSRLVQVIFIRK